MTLKTEILDILWPNLSLLNQNLTNFDVKKQYCYIFRLILINFELKNPKYLTFFGQIWAYETKMSTNLMNLNGFWRCNRACRSIWTWRRTKFAGKDRKASMLSDLSSVSKSFASWWPLCSMTSSIRTLYAELNRLW